MEQQTQQVTLQLSINQINVVLAGIAKLPIEVGLDTFDLIKQQAQKQLGAPEGPLSNKVVQ